MWVMSVVSPCVYVYIYIYVHGPQLFNDNWSCTGIILLKSVLIYSKCTLCTLHTVYADFQFHSACARHSFSVSSGLDERDAAFMQRLRNLAQEALTWPHLGERQRLVWAAALELDAVPFQELPEDSHVYSCSPLTHPYCS